MAEGARFCPACGQPASSISDMPTQDTTPRTPRRPSSHSPARPPSSSGSVTDLGRFGPGEVLIDRYRIIALLGRGGMGEVYRADDLKLAQAVALKFLPESAGHRQTEAAETTALERFRAEVRNARQVAHPNVCRVYDIGEIDGRPFLSMEYVDGEDLASLLRRIGRLPAAKALEIARQLCAGLAAAHDKGVLHRDLKPANIMIDGLGHARITDFGLAVRAEEDLAGGAIVGTPAYMSPEQLAGKAATVKSDLYALGLVLYEIFTGKKAFEAKTIGEWKRKHEEEQPSAPSSVVAEIDPAVERIVLRCLEKDPKLRPASALAVAAGLPGGDPLAAALAAGETPSPDLVAAAGETEGFKPREAIACLSFVIVGIAAALVLMPKALLTGIVPLGDSPQVMAAKAQSLIRKFGYVTPPVDSAYAYAYDNDYLRYIEDHDKSRNRWDQLRTGNPSAIEFWYRESPRYLEVESIFDGPAGGVILQDDPPRKISGMTYAELDPNGRLEYFEAVPPQKDEAKGIAPAPDWSALFTAAGLDMTKFKAAEPEWTPPQWSDTRAAWTGTAPGRPDVPLRVEAAAYRGKPVYFQLIWPWTRAGRMQAFQQAVQMRTIEAVELTLFLAVLIGAVLLARRNLRLARGDRRGAFRLAIFVFLLFLCAWALTAHHVGTSYEFGLFVMGASFALFVAAVAWLLYIGLEPYVRRRWPSSMISWSRVLAGQLRDPLVGRDLLTGVALGVGFGNWLYLSQFAEGWFGKLPPEPGTSSLFSLLGVRASAGNVLNHIAVWLGAALVLFFFFFLLRLLLRRDWLAGTVFVIILLTPSYAGKYPLVDTVFVGVFFAAVIIALKRFGLFALVAFGVSQDLLGTLIQTSHLGAWYAASTILTIVFLLALAIYGFKTSLAGQQIFSGAALDD